MRVKVDKQEFGSKKELENYVREMLKTIRINSRDVFEVSGTHFIFLSELFKRHPNYEEKKGLGIKKIYVGPEPYYGASNASHIMIQREDESRIDISWKICVAGISRNLNSVQMEILRRSIREQILNFKREVPNICNICNERCFKNEVDHVTPFKDLVKKFAKSYMLPNRFTSTDYGHEFHPDDEILENKWKQFHLEFASLQKLCSLCHKKKTYRR